MRYLTDRSTVLAVLRDHRSFAGFRPNGEVDEEDEAENSRFRRKLRPYLNARAVARFQPELRIQAAALINSVVAHGESGAMRYACGGLLLVLGLPIADQLIYAESEAFFSYLREAVKHAARQGMTAELLAGDDPLTETEVVGLYGMLLVGVKPTARSIRYALHALADSPQTCRRLRETPNLIEPFVEEVLRASHSAGTVPRITTRSVTLPNGVALDPGEEIELRIGAAGLFFGGGIRPCIGQHLARLEIAVLVSEWVSHPVTGTPQPAFWTWRG